MVDQGPIDDPFKRRCIGTELKFTFVPRRCHFTGRILWLEHAYQQTSMLTGPGDPIFDYRWYDKDEFLLAKIKGIV